MEKRSKAFTLAVATVAPQFDGKAMPTPAVMDALDRAGIELTPIELSKFAQAVRSYPEAVPDDQVATVMIALGDKALTAANIKWAASTKGIVLSYRQQLGVRQRILARLNPDNGVSKVPVYRPTPQLLDKIAEHLGPTTPTGKSVMAATTGFGLRLSFRDARTVARQLRERNPPTRVKIDDHTYRAIKQLARKTGLDDASVIRRAIYQAISMMSGKAVAAFPAELDDPMFQKVLTLQLRAFAPSVQTPPASREPVPASP